MSENPRISLSNTYDPLGRRVTKTHTTEEGTTTHRYLYDGENIVAILGANQELLATILHHPDRTDTPLAITNHETNQTYYYHRDHQGSIIALTNQAGQIVERITYADPFGNIMEHTQHEVTHNPYGYTGREMDTLRLYYYRARYYSPMLHRFLSPDPIEHASGDWNWYRYVGNDPVNRVDPSGLDWGDVKNGVESIPGSILFKDITGNTVITTASQNADGLVKGGRAIYNKVKGIDKESMALKQYEKEKKRAEEIRKNVAKERKKKKEEERIKKYCTEPVVDEHGFKKWHSRYFEPCKSYFNSKTSHLKHAHFYEP